MNEAPYQVMPPLSAEEYATLKADIAENGVQVPVEYDEQGNVLDGHHRIQICGELGMTNWPRLIRHGLSEEEKRRHARRLNLHRRHLDQAQRRELIEAELLETPAASDRAVAAGLGVDGKTVGEVRAKLEADGEIPQSDVRIGLDGRKRRVVQFVPSTQGEEKGLALSARELNERSRTAYREGARDLARKLSDAAVLAPSGRKFPVIYADAPWRRKAGFSDRSAENHYPTMTWDEICALPVEARALSDAWLFLWMPRAHLLAPTWMEYEFGDGTRSDVEVPLAWRVAHAWGFSDYSTCFVWTKTDERQPEDHGNGLVVFDQDEILLLFKRGKGLPRPAGSEMFGSNYRERPREHSRKPHFYRQMIATMTGHLPVLELFGRDDPEHTRPPNWEVWGNEANAQEPLYADQVFT
jgi:ParB-like chromosome segregation protein Spo0J